MEKNTAFFAPMLYIPNGIMSLTFYANAFGAVELRSWKNDDGSIHVAELSIDRAIFHLHEVTSSTRFFTPAQHSGCTAAIGLFVNDVDEIVAKALSAGAEEVQQPKDFEYGYRQAEIKDPFGHHWIIQKKL